MNEVKRTTPTVPRQLPAAGDGSLAVRQEVTWEDILPVFLSSIDVMETTRKAYGYALRQFFRWVDSTDRRVDRLQRADVLSFKDSLMRDGNRHSPMTVALYISAIRRFYSWAQEDGMYQDISRGVRSPKRRETFVKQHLTHEESLALLDFFSGEDPMRESPRIRKFGRTHELSLRNYAIINLMLRTGLRTIEVCRLDVSDVTARRGKRILLVWGKGRDGKDNYVPLSDKAYAPIAAYLAVRPLAYQADPLFAAAGTNTAGKRLTPRQVQSVCKEGLRVIGLDDHAYSAHSLRHTCAVEILKNGGDMFDVKNMLRHVRPETSEIYVKSVEEEMRLMNSPDIYLENAYNDKTVEQMVKNVVPDGWKEDDDDLPEGDEKVETDNCCLVSGGNVMITKENADGGIDVREKRRENV